MLTSFFILLFTYLLCSIPFGYIYCRYFGIGDIRKKGSGNIGATNVFRISSFKTAALTFISDFLKGFVSVYIASLYSLESYAGLIAVIGHIFPIWFLFKNGGKGVATTFGICTFFSILLTINLALFWISLFWYYRISSISSLFVFAVLPILAYMYQVPVPMTLLISCLVFWSHRDNIKRLIQGKEHGF